MLLTGWLGDTPIALHDLLARSSSMNSHVVTFHHLAISSQSQERGEVGGKKRGKARESLGFWFGHSKERKGRMALKREKIEAC